MTDTWFVAFGLLGLLGLSNAVLTIALMRQIGVLHERVRPTGAGELDGPRRGDRLPRLDFSRVNVARADHDPFESPVIVLAYVTPGCGLCDEILPVLRSYVRSAPRGVEVVAATDVEAGDAASFGAHHRIGFPFVRNSDLAARYELPGSPYLLVLVPDDGEFLVIGAATVNTLEQLEDLVDGAMGPDPDPEATEDPPELVVANGNGHVASSDPAASAGYRGWAHSATDSGDRG